MSLMSINNIVDFYDKKVIYNLDRFIRRNTRIDLAFDTIHSAIPNRPCTILEIGSGIGEVGFRIAKSFPGSKVFGFDISPSAIDIAGRLFVAPNLHYKVSNSIAEMFSGFEPGEVDIVYMVDVYEHLDDLQKNELLRQLNATLKKDGVLILTCPTPEYQTYLHENRPDLLQPIDQSIGFEELKTIEDRIHLPITYFQVKSVWRERDYFHVVFSSSTFKWYERKKNPWRLLKSLVRQALRPKQPDKEYFDLTYKERRKKVFTELGSNFCVDNNL